MDVNMNTGNIGKQISKRVKGEELETLRAQINERKRLELFLDSLRNSDTMQDTLSVVSENSPQGLIRTGDDLIRFTEPVRKFHKRELCVLSSKSWMDKTAFVLSLVKQLAVHTTAMRLFHLF